MSIEERRESILDAVMPLVMSHGAEVTTKQIADAAGIAEGTIFRAFADKEELFHAAIARFRDPEPTFAALERIDPALSLEEKMRAVVTVYRERFAGVVGIMAAFGHRKPPHERTREHSRDQQADERARAIFARLFAADGDGIRFDATLVLYFVRLLSFGTSTPLFSGERDIQTDELVDFILRGIEKEGH